MIRMLRLATSSRSLLVGATQVLAMASLTAALLSACTGTPAAAPMSSEPTAPPPVTATEIAETQVQVPEGPPSEIVVYAADLPESAFYEFEYWDDPASPGGKVVGTPNEGGDLDPPPENDPHVIFPVSVHAGVPYRCWIHMKVGAPKGLSQANKLWVQFTGAVDAAGNEIFAPDTGSFLTAQGPIEEGWSWVGCDLPDAESAQSLVTFRTTGEADVRIQAGMEGVGFDQVVLSPAQFLENPPAAAVVEK